MQRTEFELKPESDSCAICRSLNLSRFKANASDAEERSLVSITECRDCCFAWQHPTGRTAEQSIDHFEKNYLAQDKAITNYFDPVKKREISLLELDFVAKLPIEGKRLLDVGAGAGVFAQVAAEAGWSVTAVDPALDISSLANHPGIKAIRGTTDQLSELDLFDVITMWDVIEHATMPVRAIMDANAKLKPNGWLVIETGNYKSADRVRSGLSHWMYQLDHRWYFSPDSMAQLLTQLGYSEFVYSSEVLRPGWSGSASYPGPSRSQLLKSIAKDPLNAPQHIAKFRDLRQAKGWGMAGLGIFTIAGKKRGRGQLTGNLTQPTT